MNTPLYEAQMGPAYVRLDASVQLLHRLAGAHVLHGEVRMQAPWSPLGRLAARLVGAPTRSVAGPILLRLEAGPQQERWTWQFPGGVMACVVAPQAGGVDAHLGPLRIALAPQEDAGRLRLQPLRARVFGMPLPSWWQPHFIWEESGRGRRVYFMVRTALPLVGPITAFTGYLELPEA